MVSEIKGLMIKAPPVLRYSGVFDFDGMYKMMYNWFFKQRYEFNEDLYKDKVSTPLGTEIEIKWSAFKKVTEFHKFIIFVNFHLWDTAEVDVIKGGQKVKMTRCRMQIIMNAQLDIDYANQFDENSYTKKMLHFLEHHIIDKDIEFLYFDRLTYIVYELHAEVKKYLGMSTNSNAY